MASRDVPMGDSSKLEGNLNYSVWSFKMRNMLSREDTWRLVDPPAGTVAPTTPAEIAALQLQKNKALTMIALSVRDNVIPYISNVTEPDECWRVLKDLYANNTNSRKLLLRRKLTNLKMQEGSSMSEFLQHLKELLNEFACIGLTVTDAEIVEHVLMALPESYEGLVNTLMYRPALPTASELTVILMQDDIRRELRVGKRVEDEALFIKSAFIKSEIQQAFEMSDLGLLSYSLGIEFMFRPDGISVTQRQYIREMLTEFGLDKCKPAPTPMMEKLRLLPDMQAPPADSALYQRMVGKLIFLTHTRVDIAFAVSIVSRFMNSPQEPHAQAVKRIYRYLRGTSDLALLYRRGEETHLQGKDTQLQVFTDADWAADMHDRKSTTGYIFFLRGTPITWNSRKQPTVALSSTESEYMAVTEGAKEAVWLRRLLGKIHALDLQASTTIHGDNQGSLNLAQNPIYHGRTKHIEVRHHFIREKIASGEINLAYVSTNEQLADILTKPLGKIAFERLREQLGLTRLETSKNQ
ncbi:hypothetical protein AXG93_2772s1250 [Marchantia polymorpha subsp. ruderalis]|uniref:Reverse transcriptase Ty1/copia-type domain-containing protein n=1 Tax=Marchantia polymorpha subsp. ruderalis TaxID=1480154 RepID=A0A176WI96_MARPO|nr:hypothetical protein AXG93_2772s1250 [Marchantia polymorpha subsp. ruderalis]